MSRQPRRARISNIDYLARYQIIRYLPLTEGCIFDRKLLYDKFSELALYLSILIPILYADWF